jgi:hypothetical protein
METPTTLPLSTVERLWEGVFPQSVWGGRTIFPDRLPDDLPLDLPVPFQTTLVGSAVRPPSLTTVLFETSLLASDVRAFYDRELAQQGWQKLQVPPLDRLVELERDNQPPPVEETDGDGTVALGGSSFVTFYMTEPALDLDAEGWVYRAPGIDQEIWLSLSLREASATQPQPFSIMFSPYTFHSGTEETDHDRSMQIHREWLESQHWEDFYQLLPFRRDLLPLPDLQSVPDLQTTTTPGSGLPEQWGAELMARSGLSRSAILAAFADRLETAGWQPQTASATNLLAQQAWHCPDADGKLWEFAYYLLDADPIADRLHFWGNPPLPEAAGVIHHYIGEVSIRRAQSRPVPLPNPLPETVSSHFADLLLGDYRLGELPETWPEAFLVPPGSTIVISRCQHPTNSVAASQPPSDRQLVLDVPLPPAETEALYRRTLREQGWQPLCGFVTQRLASGLPQDADVQTYARGQQQLIYSVRSLDQPGESDVRLCLVGRSVPLELEELGAAELSQDRPTWTATEHGVNCRTSLLPVTHPATLYSRLVGATIRHRRFRCRYCRCQWALNIRRAGLGFKKVSYFSKLNSRL